MRFYSRDGVSLEGGTSASVGKRTAKDMILVDLDDDGHDHDDDNNDDGGNNNNKHKTQ